MPIKGFSKSLGLTPVEYNKHLFGARTAPFFI
jgi:hypothetical protein